MNTMMIGIAGGSGSGKSTFTNRIKERFKENVTIIYHDSYYRDQSHLPMEERVRVNYDHPDSLETELLIKHLHMLRHGESIDCPVYDFTVHNRSDRTRRIDPSRIILVEGILVLSDPALREFFDLKVYVDADADERILRRIRRDVKERGRDLDGIIDQYLTTVKPMHAQFVEPAKSNADIVLNSGKNDQAFALVEAIIEKNLTM